MGGSRTVAETLTQQDSLADVSRMDVEGEEKDEPRKSNAQKEHQTTKNDENINGGVAN